MTDYIILEDNGNGEGISASNEVTIHFKTSDKLIIDGQTMVIPKEYLGTEIDWNYLVSGNDMAVPLLGSNGCPRIIKPIPIGTKIRIDNDYVTKKND